MCSYPTIIGMVDLRNFASIRATIIDAPLKQTKGWLQ
jgi:hypothetical protein